MPKGKQTNKFKTKVEKQNMLQTFPHPKAKRTSDQQGGSPKELGDNPPSIPVGLGVLGELRDTPWAWHLSPIHPGVSREQIYCQTIVHIPARNAGLCPALGHRLLPAMERDTYSIPCPMGQNWWRVFILYSKIKTKQNTHTQRNGPWSLDTPTLILYWSSSNVTWFFFVCGGGFFFWKFSHIPGWTSVQSFYFYYYQ